MNGEITSTGVHVGQGMTLHFHGGRTLLQREWHQLYNIEDYVGKQHPPLVGFGLDGIAIYGKHESAYSSMDGYSVAMLDEYGGHDHDDYGYHYHAHAEGGSSTDKRARRLQFYSTLSDGICAYKGNINNIPDFQNGGTNQLKDSDLATFVGLEGTYVTTSFDTSTTAYTVGRYINRWNGHRRWNLRFRNQVISLSVTADTPSVLGAETPADPPVNPLSLTVDQLISIRNSDSLPPTGALVIQTTATPDQSVIPLNGWYELSGSFGSYYPKFKNFGFIIMVWVGCTQLRKPLTRLGFIGMALDGCT